MIGVPSSDPGPVTVCTKPGGIPACSSSVHSPQMRERRPVVGFGQHRVARHESGQRVADPEGERIVPRRDDTDEPLGVQVFPHLGEHQLHALPTLGPQVFLGGVRVVARRQGDVDDFLERVPSRFSVLQLDQVEHLVLMCQHQVVQAQQHVCPFGYRPGRPLRLHFAGPVRRRDHVVSGAVRHVSERPARHGVGDVTPAGWVGGLNPPRQVAEQRFEAGVAIASLQSGHDCGLPDSSGPKQPARDGGTGGSLQQPRHPPVGEHLAAGLTGRAVLKRLVGERHFAHGVTAHRARQTRYGRAPAGRTASPPSASPPAGRPTATPRR